MKVWWITVPVKMFLGECKPRTYENFYHDSSTQFGAYRKG
jgi:hypothetical protein